MRKIILPSRNCLELLSGSALIFHPKYSVFIKDRHILSQIFSQEGSVGLQSWRQSLPYTTTRCGWMWAFMGLTPKPAFIQFFGACFCDDTGFVSLSLAGSVGTPVEGSYKFFQSCHSKSSFENVRALFRAFTLQKQAVLCKWNHTY